MLEFLEAFILLLVIMDPVVSLSALITMTGGKDRGEIRRIAVKSILVAAAIFLLFAFGGDAVFTVLGVDINSFRAAGGIILVLLGIRLALGLSFPSEKEDISEVAVVIGTPLISGPAAITTTILLVKDIGLATTLMAGVSSLILILAVLLSAFYINRVAGRSGMKVLSTMMGIVTIAWGIKFLMTGFLGFFV